MLRYSNMKANLMQLKSLVNFGRDSTEVILTPAD